MRVGVATGLYPRVGTYIVYPVIFFMMRVGVATGLPTLTNLTSHKG